MILIKPFKKIIFSFLLLSFFCANLFAAPVSGFNEEDFIVDFLWQKVSGLPEGERPKTALVLGGGGARGFAHIGVLKVFETENIPVDLIVGTSIGSIAGAFYAAGVPVEKIEALTKSIRWQKISNYNIPSVIDMLLADKMLSNDELEVFIRENIGDLRFDQLLIPLVCVATDLNTGERILLKEGNVAFAARASSTIPGFFKPVEYRQRYLVDGGINENIPVNVAKYFEPDIIIAVPVSADITKHSTDNIFSILMQSMYIQGKVLDDEHLRMADVIIRPDAGDISMIDLKNAYKSIDKGFTAAKDSLKNIKIVIINKTPEKFLIE